MCGIVGGLGPACKKNQILVGQKQLEHRGKDESVFSCCGQAGFWAMNRLSIQDTQTGLYPFRYKHFELIFNGEIYNLATLTQILKKHGIKLKTKCDAEIILPLFDLFGTAAFEKIDGMFAIAIFDNKQDCFYLARDLFGEKPLYYVQTQKACYFASELPALPATVHHLSPQAIPEFLTFGFLNHNRTFYQDVFKVLPGECVQLSPTILHTTQFSKLSNYVDKSKIYTSENKQVADLTQKLQKIVAKKMVGEAPIGIFLSGGLDSSLLTALVQTENRQQNLNSVFTYSIGFHSKENDESAAAIAVAKHLHTKHTQVQFDHQDLKRTWQKLTAAGDEPISDPASFATLLLAERAQQDVKVIFTGEGADEIFGGYSRYAKMQFTHVFNSNWLSKLLAAQTETSLNVYKLFTQVASCYSPVSYLGLWQNQENRSLYLGWLSQVWQETVRLEPAFSQLKLPHNLQLYDLKHYVAEQLCMKVDKMLMQQTIESRAPFLDKSLLPFLQLNDSSRPKFLLRQVAQEYLPSEIVNQPKHGFSLPLKQILTGPLQAELKQLEAAHVELTKIISQTEISKLSRAFQNGHSSLNNTIWNLVTLNSWLLQHQS